MTKLKGKTFGLQHLLEGHENWKSRNDNASPKTEKCNNSSSKMDDGDDDDGDGEEREKMPTNPSPASSMGQPDKRKRLKGKLKREGEVEAMKKLSVSWRGQ